MKTWTRLVIYKPALFYLELQQFHQNFVCWFSGLYTTRKMKCSNQFLFEHLRGKLRFKQSLPILVSNFYQIQTLQQFQRKYSQTNLMRANFEQSILGAMVGFKNGLRVRGVGYRFDVSPLKIIVHAGYSHPLIHKLSGQISFESLTLNKKSTLFMHKSADLPVFSTFLSTIRNLRYPDVYKGKGIRYQKDFIIRKEGKKKKTT